MFLDRNFCDNLCFGNRRVFLFIISRGPSRSVSSIIYYTVCPTRYRTRHFFNDSNTNEDIAKKFEQEYVRGVRNEEECVCSTLQISLQYPN